jgi:hypothetical protein
MQSLRKQQTRFVEALLDDATTVAGVLPAQRIDVYRNNFLEGHRKALAATYPVVAALVGDACFRTLAYDYARGFPSRAGDLGQFGGEFSFFLRALYAATEHAYLIDVARFEWAHADALNAADATPLDLQRLAGALDADELTFTFHPSVRLVRSPFPVLAIWQAHQDERDFQIDLSAGEDRLLVHRPLLDVQVLALDVAQYAFIEELYHRQPLAHALDHALSLDTNFDLTAALALLITHRVLTDCATGAAASEHTFEGVRP